MGFNKRYREITFAIIVVMLALILACDNSTCPEPESTVYLSTYQWEAPDSGGVSDSIKILSADTSIVHQWRVVNSADWIAVSSDSGATPDGFVIMVDPNISGADRAVTVKVVVDNEVPPAGEFRVSQKTRHGLVTVGNYLPPHCSEALFVEGDFVYMGGCGGGLIIVDARDPSHPYDYSWYPPQCREQCIHKSGNYVYVAGLHTENLQVTGMVEIYDVSNPLRPALQSSINTDYTLGCAVSGDNLYLADFDGLRVYDVSDPTSPDSVAFIGTTGGTIATATYQNYVMFSEEDSGIRIADVSDPANPTVVGQYQIPGLVGDIFISGHYAYLACHDNGVKILDISNPGGPVLAGEFSVQGQAYGVYVKDNLAYVAAPRNWIHILNVADVTNPVLVATSRTPSQVAGVSVSGDYVYAIDRDYGLFVMRLIP